MTATPHAPKGLVAESAVSLVHALATREVSAVEVAGAHLDRIDEVNGEVNAIVTLRDREAVLADAADLDNAHSAEKGKVLGPLHGLPVAVKDLEPVAGLRTSYGSRVSSDRPAAADGHIAAQLRAAGALIIGKTNTPEFGTGSHTFNEVFGVTRNPWNLAKTAGGSSGGAAAALAARMLPIADGSDLGGSLRNPAAMCNVVGLRPSVGRVAEPAAVTTHLRLGVSGPMGRTVADTALLLSAMAGPHPNDPLALRDPGSAFSGPLSTTTKAKVAWAGDFGLFRCAAEVLDICKSAAGQVTEAGGTFVEAAPDLSTAESIFRVLRGASYAGLGQRLGPDALPMLKETVRENIAFGQSLTVHDIGAAEARKADLHRTMSDFFDEYDVIALPASQVPPFPVETEYPTEIDGEAMPDYLSWMLACCVITPTGCPAISIPAGFTSSGLPVGLQLVARVGHDRQLLEVAAAIEAANPFHQLVPGC